MKALLTLLLITLHVHAVTLLLNSAQENQKPYATLHLIHDVPIQCEVTKQEFDKELYICAFDKVLKNEVKSKKTPLVDIDFFAKEKQFFIQIAPKSSSRMMNMDAKLYDHPEVPLPSTKRAKHWVFVIYNELPYAQQNSEDGINFPVTYPDLKRPSVGALDLNGAPIGYVRSKDINAYLDLKKNYEAGRFDATMDIAMDALKKYPHTIFRSEFSLYYIRAMDALMDVGEDNGKDLDRNDIVTAGKRWIKTFPSDENLPEMLMLIAKAYLKMGFGSDANYFLDILVSEHPENKFTKWAILLYADTLYNGRKRPEALRLYEDVLYSAKDLDMASEAAIRLANNRIDQGKVKEAKEYLVKILAANTNFLIKDQESAYALAEKLAANQLEDIAAQISDALLQGMKRGNEIYEPLIKDTGLWYAKAHEIEKAYSYLKRYQKEYRNGDFVEEVQRGLDELFFELSETNTTKLNEYYDTLMSRYDNEIGDKALLEKAKLLLSQERYQEVLDFESSLRQAAEQNATEATQLIEDAAFGQMHLALKNDQCLYAVKLAETYTIAERLDDRQGLYDCFMRLSRFESASEEALLHVKHEDLSIRLDWMLRLESALYAMGAWQKTLEVAQDIEKLGSVLKTSKASEGLYEHFFALMKLERQEEALEIVKKIEAINATAFKNVEVYGAIAQWAKEQGNDLLVETYAKQAIAIQERASSFIMSPMLEYNLISALQRLNKIEEAKKVALGLLAIPQEEAKKTRALYMVGELSLKLNDETEAKNYFEQCANAQEGASWKSICESNLKLLQSAQ